MGLIQPGEGVAVFIDGQFLVRGLNVTCPGQRFDYRKIAAKLVSPGRLVRVGFYTAPPPDYLPEEAKAGHTAQMATIRGFPFFDVFEGQIRQRRRKVVPDGQEALIFAKYWEQKGVDVRIALDMLGKAYHHQYDVAVLVSGDGDFIELARLVREAGKHVLNATCPRNRERRYTPSGKLERACDGHMMDATFLQDCRLEQRTVS